MQKNKFEHRTIIDILVALNFSAYECRYTKYLLTIKIVRQVNILDL